MRRAIKTMGITFLLSSFLLSGCGQKLSEEMSTYKASMETFCGNIAYINDEINNIDSESETAVSDLLSYLDTLDDQFLQMSELEVPEEFVNVEELADEASENMTMAVSYYHQAYDSDEFNQNYVDAADEYYERANLRLTYILDILHGEDINEIIGSTAGDSAETSQNLEDEKVNESEALDENSNETSAE